MELYASVLFIEHMYYGVFMCSANDRIGNQYRLLSTIMFSIGIGYF